MNAGKAGPTLTLCCGLLQIAELAPGSLAGSEPSKRITWTLGFQRERTLVSAFSAFNSKVGVQLSACGMNYIPALEQKNSLPFH